MPIAWAVVSGGVIGALIGSGGLGRAGLFGAAIGAMSGGLLPYLLIAPTLNLGSTEPNALDHYAVLADHYLPIAIVASGSAIAGALWAARLSFRIRLRLGPTLAVGLILLAVWLLCWTFWALVLAPQTV